MLDIPLSFQSDSNWYRCRWLLIPIDSCYLHFVATFGWKKDETDSPFVKILQTLKEPALKVFFVANFYKYAFCIMHKSDMQAVEYPALS